MIQQSDIGKAPTLKPYNQQSLMTNNDGNHFLELLNDDLALNLGRAVWTFAQIEWLTYEYMRELSGDTLDVLMGNQLFKARTTLIINLLERLDVREKERALDYIKRADKLADVRNTIVQNPWKIWIDLKQKDFRTEIQTYNNHQKKFDLSALQKFIKDAQEIASGLEQALGAITLASKGQQRKHAAQAVW